MKVIPVGKMQNAIVQQAPYEHVELRETIRKAVDDAGLNVTERWALNKGFFPDLLCIEFCSLRLQIRQPLHQVAVFAPIRKIRIYQIRIGILQRFAFEFCIGTGIDFSGFDITVSEKVTDIY